MNYWLLSVAREIEPKKRSLEESEQQLKKSQDLLQSKQELLRVVEARLTVLQSNYEKSLAQKSRLEFEITKTKTQVKNYTSRY